MKKMRLLAWLLVVATLMTACAALGEALDIEPDADAALPELIAAEDALNLEGPDALDLELPEPDLPELDLADGLSDALEVAAEAGESEAGALAGNYLPRGGLDNDALFAGYVDLLFGRRGAPGLSANGWVGDRLTGVAARLYGYLLKQVEKVAAGKLGDTAFIVPGSVVSDSEAEEAMRAVSIVINALLADCPYQLFWYDKTASTMYGMDYSGFYVFFPVASEYALGQYETNASLIRSAHVAVKKAKSVVKKYAGVSDYDKLCGYRDYICGAVRYNNDAAYDPSRPYGNPWQLIWVFDGNSDTDVVCEGYAKAFQYLCDLSAFEYDIQCHCVEGYVQDGWSYGAHMWNIIAMGNGANYHVDVTFVDTGMPELFLCGASATGTPNAYQAQNGVCYTLDGECAALYPASALKLSARDYNPDDVVQPKSVRLKRGSVTLKKGQQISLKRGKSLTLKAALTPANASTRLTWTSNYKYVTVKDGKVTVSSKAKAGAKAKITVRTANGKSTFIYIAVK